VTRSPRFSRTTARLRRICLLLGGWTALQGSIFAGPSTLESGHARLQTHTENGIWISFSATPDSTPHLVPAPLILEVNGVRSEGRYERADFKDGALLCEGTLRSLNGTRFVFSDRYRAGSPGGFELSREVLVSEANPDDISFNSAYRVRIAAEFQKQEYFVPAVWYRTNFAPRIAGALASDPDDQVFLFREDRLPLPLVAARDVQTGSTLSMVHTGADPATFEGDAGLERVVDERMQFGSLGVDRRGDLALMFLFPGSEGEKNRTSGSPNQGWSLRSHPVRTGVAHRYALSLKASSTSSYAAAVEQTWKAGFASYQPKIRPVDVTAAFQGLLETLHQYAVLPRDGYDAPGFPFSVLLPDGQVRAYNYQSGFIGRQIPNAFFLIHEGLAQGRNDWLEKGEAIVDFWARESLLPDGFPRTWYDPSRKPGGRGTWRTSDNRHGGTALRTAATGMEGLLSAWETLQKHQQPREAWLLACRSFGDWLVANQNEDGSFHLAYEHALTDGKHRATHPSKATTANPIRYLTQLHRATSDRRYLDAAVRAGEFCWREVHQNYFYAGSVIDNPVTIDRESGQEALAAFLALRDATHDPRWLEAAVQAARFTETWMIAYEIPPVNHETKGFPSDKSLVGQTLIATGQSSADLGLAFSSVDFYRLFLFTGDDHFLQVARLLIHNTKQALNWDGTLYPGKARGLQMEAFLVSMPRRRGVMECLSWNFAAHLDPLVRLKDRFGSIDLDTVERLPLTKRRALNE
jgi:hypothetical protein